MLADSREHEEAIVRDNRARLFVDKLVQRIQKLMRRSMVFRMKGLEKMVSIKPLRDSIRLTTSTSKSLMPRLAFKL